MSSDRLPTPVMQVGFDPTATLPDCLRAALRTAQRCQVGVLFERDGEEYIVQPWHTVDQALELADVTLAASVREHLQHG
jgi:hypothetical protein